MEFVLEKHFAFPFIAWLLVISFATFTYSLAYKLQNGEGFLEQHQSLTQEYLNQ